MLRFARGCGTRSPERAGSPEVQVWWPWQCSGQLGGMGPDFLKGLAHLKSRNGGHGFVNGGNEAEILVLAPLPDTRHLQQGVTKNDGVRKEYEKTEDNERDRIRENEIERVETKGQGVRQEIIRDNREGEIAGKRDEDLQKQRRKREIEKDSTEREIAEKREGLILRDSRERQIEEKRELLTERHWRKRDRRKERRIPEETLEKEIQRGKERRLFGTGSTVRERREGINSIQR